MAFMINDSDDGAEMKIAILIALASLASAAVIPAAVATPHQTAATEGKEVALEICAYCHVVAADQPFAPELKQPARSFSAIANDPGANAASLGRFVATTHWDEVTYPMTMPNPLLLDDERDQVVAYILSLRTAGPPQPPQRLSPHERQLQAGEYVALQLCSYCHAVSEDLRYRPDAGPSAPSFADISAKPGVDAKFLRRFLATTHWDSKTMPMTMPSPMLSGQETEDVIAYMLRAQKRP